MIKLQGHIEVNNGVRIVTNWDLCRYYQWLFNKYHFNIIKNQLPRHKSHVSILLPDIHGIKNFDKVKFLNGKRVSFFINPEKVTITKKNCWLAVVLDKEAIKIANFIKKVYNVNDKGFWGYHLVILNFKFNDPNV